MALGPRKPEQASIVETLAAKRQELLTKRDAYLAELVDLNEKIAAFDDVISVYDPKHVRLEIKQIAADTPILTLTAEPGRTISEKADKPKAHVRPMKRTGKPRGKQSKGDAIARLNDLMSPLDRVSQITDILAERPDGMPFRELCAEFATKNNFNIDEDVDKIYRQRMSVTMFSLQQTGKVEKVATTTPRGTKENLWKIATGVAKE